MRGTLPLALLILPLSGCVGVDDETVETTAGPAPSEPAVHVLAGALEPAELEPPTWRLFGAVGRGGPVYGAGEPSIWAHLDGTLYLAFPGCDRGFYLVRPPGLPGCDHGVVHRSDDGGATWSRLNGEQDGRLTADGPAANGDADVAVDAAGTVYTSNLGGGIQVFRSTDSGQSWAYAANVVPEDHWADRQWMAAGKAGHLVMAWMGGEGSQRAVAVRTTWDAGATWTPVAYVGERIGWLGTVQLDASGTRAFLPFTQPTGAAPMLGAGAREFELLVARSLDAGRSWDVVDTGVRVEAPGDQWSGVLMAPALDVTGDGHVVVGWSEAVLGPAAGAAMGARVKLVASGDWGLSWGEPLQLSTRAAAIMPWVTGGAGDRVAVTWYASDVPLDTDYAGSWDVEAAYVDGLDPSSARTTITTVDRDVHVGGICSRGGGCIRSGSDRALLDFFETDLLPDGRLAITYGADPLHGGKYIEIRVAVQDAGTPLLTRAA